MEKGAFRASIPVAIKYHENPLWDNRIFRKSAQAGAIQSPRQAPSEEMAVIPPQVIGSHLEIPVHPRLA